RRARSALRQRPPEPARASEIAFGAARNPPLDRTARAEGSRTKTRLRKPDRGLGPLLALTAPAAGKYRIFESASAAILSAIISACLNWAAAGIEAAARDSVPLRMLWLIMRVSYECEDRILRNLMQAKIC